MVEEVDEFEAGRIELGVLAENLRGLLGASDLKTDRLIGEWWDHFQPIDMELEVRTEAWAPAGYASDGHLSKALATFRGWVLQVLTNASDERS
jgi:hypothetical protein